MLERKNKLVNHFSLTSEQRVALLEAKISRAQAQIQALAEQAKIMEKARQRLRQQ
jgi:hypothetical protein